MNTETQHEAAPLLSAEKVLGTWTKIIRSRYGLSQRGLAVLMGVGTVTICRWEKEGAQIDTALEIFLSLLIEPENMRRLEARRGDLLPRFARRKLRLKLAESEKKTHAL